MPRKPTGPSAGTLATLRPIPSLPAPLARRIRASLVVVLAVLYAGPATGAPEPDPTEPCAQAQSVVVRQLVPCTGILLPEAWARRALACVEVDLPQARALAELQVGTLEADLGACTETLTAARGALDSCEESAAKVIAPEPQWWRHPALWATVGLVVGVGGTVLVWRLVD